MVNEGIKRIRMISPILAKLMNLSIVLYGHPGVGKTTLAANICKQLTELTKRKALYFAIDENLNTPFGSRIKNLSNAEWIRLDYPHPRTLMNFLTRMKKKDQYCTIVVDSITGLFETLVEEYGSVTDPRINLALIRYASVITRILANYSHTYKMTTILIAHVGATFTDDWLGLNEKPAFSLRAVKNVDVVVKMFMENQKRKIRIMFNRVNDELNDAIYTVEEVLGKKGKE